MKTADMNGTKCEPQSLNEEKPTQNTADDQKGFCNVSETSQHHSQSTDKGQDEDEDQVREVIKEWTNVEEFHLRRFFLILFSASMTFFDFFSDSLLGIQFLQEGFVLNSSETKGEKIDDSCTELDITTFNYDEYNETRQYNVGLYTCDKYNRMYGFATLAISFLPGIQWHAYLKTKYSLGKFLTSLFFPFFMVIFQVSRFSKVFSDVKGHIFWDPY